MQYNFQYVSILKYWFLIDLKSWIDIRYSICELLIILSMSLPSLVHLLTVGDENIHSGYFIMARCKRQNNVHSTIHVALQFLTFYTARFPANYVAYTTRVTFYEFSKLKFHIWTGYWNIRHKALAVPLLCVIFVCWL